MMFKNHLGKIQPVVHQLQMLYGLNVQKTPPQKASAACPSAWRLSLRPIPSSVLIWELWPPVGRPSVTHRCCHACGCRPELWAEDCGLRSCPSGHELLTSSKTFLWLNFVPWACRLQRNRMFTVCTKAVPAEEGLCVGWSQLPSGAAPPYLAMVVWWWRSWGPAVGMGVTPGNSVPGCPYFSFWQQEAYFSFLPCFILASSQCWPGVFSGFDLHWTPQNSVQLCSEGGNSTRIQNLGLVLDSQVPQGWFIPFALLYLQQWFRCCYFLISIS